VQRVSRAHVSVGKETVGQTGRGFLVLLGVAVEDEETDAERIAQKIAGLRVFEDEEGQMNLDLHDVEGEVLLISQFTLLGDARKGRRPSFAAAAPGPVAERLYERVAAHLRATGLHVECGRFGAHMQVELVNNGPVTILLDSTRLF
jgi:D-tyrosyl-tRNA(Tyr) deacylase